MSIKFGFASGGDGEGILEIMESDSVKGNISLVYTRRPDPVTSFETESADTAIGVYKKEGSIVGTICGIGRKVYLNGEKHSSCYITGMKKSKKADGNINWIRSFGGIYDRLLPEVCFCSVVKENSSVINMLEKKRKKLPYVSGKEGYRTYLVNPFLKMKDPLDAFEIREGREIKEDSYVFRKAGKDDEKALLEFLNDNGSKKNLFPVIDALGSKEYPNADDFYILQSRGSILAAGALWDRSDVKQYIVKKCSGVMALFRKLNPVLHALGYIRIPPNEEKANMVFLSFFLAKDDNEKYYASFLSHIAKAAKKNYDVLVFGTNEHNPKRRLFDKVRAVSFDTVICEIVMSDFKEAPRIEFDYGNLETECALL